MICRLSLLRRAGAAGALLLGALAATAQAQPPLVAPAPLTDGPPLPPGAGIVDAAAAQRAQDLGLPSLAAEVYRQLLDAPNVDRRAVALALTTALLDAGRAAEAEQALSSMPEPHDAAWRLRAGLAALQLRKRDAAQAQWDAIKADEVPVADLPWYHFLTGALYDTATPRDVSTANRYYQMAEAAAPTELSRARFQLAAEIARVQFLERPNEAGIVQARENYLRYQGLALGYEYLKAYAAMLDRDGRRDEAIAELDGALRAIPAQERRARDELRFMLGLIGDRGRNGVGRNALTRLLEDAQSAERQRQALQLLAAESRGGPEREQFRALLKRLIDAKPDHPIKESLLFHRAQLALAEKDFVLAEADARELLEQFPLSPLRLHAFGVLTQSAWEQRRYRAVADFAAQARAQPPVESAPGRQSLAVPVVSRAVFANLGVLEAEAWFRSGDYRTAGDVYAAVLREWSAELDPQKASELMFQRVIAEILAGPRGNPEKVLDELQRDPRFAAEHRWQAEWHLARELLLRGDAGIKRAYARVNALLADAAGAAALKPELRARMRWLQARLSLEHGEPAETLKLIESLLREPLEIQPALRTEIGSTVVLLKARAEFALGRETDALETLRRLRAEHPRTDAAVRSYLIESEHYDARDKVDEARKALIALTDNPDYKSSEYAPYALYRLALLSERLGREENLREANKRIEELVELVGERPAPGHADLLFAARLRQGDIFRKRNDFDAARRAYEDLVNRYPRRPDVVYAQLALAECLNTQSSADPSLADSALLLFEQLRDRVDAPPDVRVEAGYNAGKLLERRGKLNEAATAWWNDVVDPFLRKPDQPAEPGAKRLYWLARTLVELGELLEKLQQIEDAKRAYQLILEKRLPYGDAVARARLEHYRVRVAQP